MLLRIFFIMFISLSQFFNNARAQNSIINEFEGIIIYHETDSIPQDVFLIPCKVEYTGSFSDFVLNTLRDLKGQALEIYFQGMRWGMPNLLEVVKKMNYIKGKRITTNENSFQLRISAGKIFSDATFTVKVPGYRANNTEFLIEIESKRFSFTTSDYDREKNGLPVFFEPIDIRH